MVFNILTKGLRDAFLICYSAYALNYLSVLTTGKPVIKSIEDPKELVSLMVELTCLSIITLSSKEKEKE